MTKEEYERAVALRVIMSIASRENPVTKKEKPADALILIEAVCKKVLKK